MRAKVCVCLCLVSPSELRPQDAHSHTHQRTHAPLLTTTLPLSPLRILTFPSVASVKPLSHYHAKHP